MGSGPDLSAVLDERRRLINVAYRLLGSLAEAEDAVQETYARWFALSRRQQEAIASPGAWLTTVAGRICLDVLGSARVRRERYVGSWLPEPLPDRDEWLGGRADDGRAGSTDPADQVTLDESVNMAFLVVLESMTPAERVAFVLHDVFRYPFAEIAEIVGRTPAACRQLASSARRRGVRGPRGFPRSGRPDKRPDSRQGRRGTRGRPCSCGGSRRRGRPGTSRPSSGSSTPTPRWSPTAAAWSAPSSARSRAARTSPST